MLYPQKILDALSDPSKLLHLTKGHTALLNSVVRNNDKNVGVNTERTFFHRYFERELIGFSRLALVVSIIDS